MVMRFGLSALCIAAVTFLLRVLVALLKEARSWQPRTAKIYLAKFNLSRKRGELIFMNSTKREKSSLEAGKRAALTILAVALLAPLLRGQQITPNPSDSAESTNQASSTGSGQIPPAIAKELDAMKQRIAQLEAELEQHQAEGQPATMQTAKATAPAAIPQSALVGSSAVTTPLAETSSPAETKPAKEEPFAFADWTWLNGNARTKTPAFDSKFFTPEIRTDVSYIHDFNHPQDNTIGGSSEVFRANEVQVTQLGVGGDFHYDNVRARLMTQFGMYSQTTPRNDASPARGQWNLADAYRYVSEAYGGYHFNALHGINVDAGIFMSYVGLFSYYNFDNWAYQPSYVSSNTPWFFNGLRVQVFPTAKLKIEPWFVNGWQSYGRFNHRPGLGGQVLWRPTSAISIISNNYGLGTDTLGNTNRSRYHTDNSIQIKYYENPAKMLDRMAFSLTGDAGCESGGGASCYGNTRGGPKQSFLGYMVYNRFWFHKDMYGVTLGGGQMNNPGRYLVLLPPINGATAASGTPYFSENPGDPFKAWDISSTFDYMPSQYITFRWEYDHRAANVPYFSGKGGITPPGGNTGAPGSLVTGFAPDLVRDENRLNLAILVKF
jgi:hypothetical protein